MLSAVTKERNMSRPEGAASTWPMLLALVALFALCLTAPRAWYGSARTVVTLAPDQMVHGEPTLAPPKKKRQVVVGQDAHDVAKKLLPAKPRLPDIEEQPPVEPLSVEPLAITPGVVSLPRVDTSTSEPIKPTVELPTLEQPLAAPQPVLAYPEARVASQPLAPLPEIPAANMPMIVVEPLPKVDAPSLPRRAIVTAAPQPQASPLPAVTAPVEPSVSATPATPMPESSAQTPAPTTAPAQTDLTASLPKRTELPLPTTTTAPSADALATPKIEAQPESPRSATLAKPGPQCWPLPTDLLAQLDKLASEPSATEWAAEVRKTIVALTAEESPRSQRSQELLTDLADLLSQLNTSVAQLGDTPQGDELRRVGYSLARRIDMWSLYPQLAITPVAATAQTSPQRLSTTLASVVNVADQSSLGPQWREFLLVDALKDLAVKRDSIRIDEQRALVRRVLDRLEKGMPAWQTQYASATPLVDLQQELRNWGHEPVDTHKLLADIEAFEQFRTTTLARPIAVSYLKLAKSPDATERQLARQIETHYRNANLRLTFTDDMVNRFLARSRSQEDAVNDNVGGLPTRGWSRTHTDVHVRFIPDPSRVRMALEARGKIFSRTYTVSGPVTVDTEANSTFKAAKEFQLSMEGFEVGETEVEADSRPILKGIKSQFDHMPFLRSFVQGIARNKYDETQPKATAEARKKIRSEVRTHIDTEISGHIRSGNTFFRDHVTGPLDDLGISPHLIESQTTEDRCTMRLRMATSEQLAGHGPRPRAPSSSLASMQMHETVINNVLHQLGWAGQTYTLPQLRDQIAGKLKTKIDMPDEENLKDLYVTFAQENPIRVRCRDGHMELNLAFARLRKGQQSWKDFQVRVMYRPDLSQPGAPFCRQGTVQLIGDRLNTGAQIALRGIFSKAFPPSRQMKLIPDKLVAEKPGLADVIVTQCDLRDGWVGIALSVRGDARQEQATGQAEPPQARTGALLPIFRR